MEYKIQATQTIHKYFTVEAENEAEALEIAQNKVAEGEIRFDEKLFLDMEMSVVSDKKLQNE